jgi:hypothetical protein
MATGWKAATPTPQGRVDSFDPGADPFSDEPADTVHGERRTGIDLRTGCAGNVAIHGGIRVD